MQARYNELLAELTALVNSDPRGPAYLAALAGRYPVRSNGQPPKPRLARIGLAALVEILKR